MKTSEFRKYLEENWNYEETEDYFDILGIGLVYKNSNRIEKLSLYDATIKLFSKIYEYAQTPLEEREEEKKYRLRLNDYFRASDLCGVYLNLLTDTNDYTFNESGDSTNGYKTDFTQKEIDVMPFDTNFFIKEEVV